MNVKNVPITSKNNFKNEYKILLQKLYSHKKATQHDFKTFKNTFFLLLKNNIHILLNLVQFPIQWWVKLFFVTIMNNAIAIASHEHTPYFKSCKNGLLKNHHLRLTNIFSI